MSPSAPPAETRRPDPSDGAGADAPPHGRRYRGLPTWTGPLLIGVLTFLSRTAVGATGPTEWDSAQFASGVTRFDTTRGSPHPPGYFLYSMGGRFLHVVVGLGVIHSLVLISAVTSAAAVAAGYMAGRAVSGTWLGLATAAFLFTSPFMWFNGAYVGVFNFDALASSLFVLWALEARRGSLHGVFAVLTLAILGGFRQSIAFLYLPVAAVAVLRSTASLRRWAAVIATGAIALAVWMVPLILIQPGGFSAWYHASHIETQGQLRTTSILDHGVVSHQILLTMLGETLVALAPLLLVFLVAVTIVSVRGLARRVVAVSETRTGPDRTRIGVRVGVVVLAILPSLLVAVLIQFGTGGYALAYLPGAGLLLLLPAAAVVGSGPYDSLSRERLLRPAAAVLTLVVAGVCAVDAQRFLSGRGVLPARYVHARPAAWFLDPVYGAPVQQTRYTISTQDAQDAALVRLRSVVSDARDVVLMPAGDADEFRQTGWALSAVPVGLTNGDVMLYWEQGGLLHYPSSSTAYVPSGGHLFFIASSLPPAVASLMQAGAAQTVAHAGNLSVVEVSSGHDLGSLHIVTGTPDLGPNLTGHG